MRTTVGANHPKVYSIYICIYICVYTYGVIKCDVINTNIRTHTRHEPFNLRRANGFVASLSDRLLYEYMHYKRARARAIDRIYLFFVLLLLLNVCARARARWRSCCVRRPDTLPSPPEMSEHFSAYPYRIITSTNCTPSGRLSRIPRWPRS